MIEPRLLYLEYPEWSYKEKAMTWVNVFTSDPE